MYYKFNDIANLIYRGAIKPDCFENICAVYVDGTQYIESTVATADIFKDTYFKNNNELVVNSSTKGPVKMKVIYYVMPELKTIVPKDGESEFVEGEVMVPIEFIELVKAKLKASLYRIANEDELCAKWTALYNVKLEEFKIWVEQKRPKFGIL